MDTNDSSFPYSHYKEGAPVDLKETYLKQNGEEHLKVVLDERICQMCKQIVNSEFTSVEVNVDTLSRFALEVNGSSKGHVICRACIDSQDTRTNSLSNSLNVKEEIDDLFDDTAIEGLSSIKVKSMEIKSEENSRDTPFPNLKGEPVNCRNDCTSEYIETTHLKCEDIEIKSEEDYSNMELGQQGHKNVLEKQTYNCNLSDYITDQKGPTTTSTSESKVKTDKIPALKQENLETHTYECDSCGYKASRIDNFRRHRLRHEDVSEKMYRCNECDYMTDKRRYLSQHQHRHRKIPEKPMLKCDSCDYKTSQKNHLRRHQLRHKSVLEKQMYPCNFCDYITDQTEALKRHVRRHKKIPEGQMNPCDLCAYGAKRKDHLKQHEFRQKHPLTGHKQRERLHKNIPKEKIYKCDTCEYKANVKDYLKRHLQRHRNIPEEQMFKCDSCDYKARRKDHLARHQLKHKSVLEKQMYPCNFCEFTTDKKENLSRHLRRYQEILQEQMYDCLTCGFNAHNKKNTCKSHANT